MVGKELIDQALLDRQNKKVIHCIEIAPGAYMVSPSFAAEIRKRAKDSEVIGDMFGVQIMTTQLLPVQVENKEVKIKVSERVVVHKAQCGYPCPTLCGQYITMGFNAAEHDDEVTCMKCLKRMEEKKS